MSELLAAKLRSPQLPSHLIQRRSLLEMLEKGRSPDKHLVLISAPAGYEKTTLVCDWPRNIPHVCWLSLEKSDNDLRAFSLTSLQAWKKYLRDWVCKHRNSLKYQSYRPCKPS